MDGRCSALQIIFMCLISGVLSQNNTKPNIIFIIADDLGWGDVGFHASDIKTPVIDSLARSGITLDNYYVSPLGSQTRAAILTGKHPIHIGMQHGSIMGATPYGVSLNETIMPQYFKDLGYGTHIVGKWHAGHYTIDHTPTKRGFDSFFGFYTGHEDYFDHVAEDGLGGYWGYDLRRNMDVYRAPTESYSTEMYTEEVNAIIRSHDRNKPLFLWMAHQAVHTGNYNGDPLQVPQKYIDKVQYIPDEKRKIFAGMVTALDESLNSVMNTLVETGLMNNSIIVFTTDNGGPANGMDRSVSTNWPLRGSKDTLWEGGIRGTGFIYSPLLLSTSGYVQKNLMHITDWLPTLYNAAGGDVSQLKYPDGYNLWDMLSTNGQNVRNEILHNFDPITNTAALRVGDFKLVGGDLSLGKYDSWYPPPGRSLAGKQTYMTCGPKPQDASTNCNPEFEACLFHMPSDPCEFKNIAPTHPNELAALLARLEIYKQSMVPPANRPIDARANPILHGGVWSPWLRSSQKPFPSLIG